MTAVSIVMGTYNGARFIREQLESLARQTVLPAELIVCDDQSSDATLKIIEDFAQTSPFPIRIERNPERLGYRHNFMKAASLCQHPIIAFCDQDDVWLPKKLETALASFTNEDVLLAYCNALAVDEQLQPLGETKLQAAPQPLNPPATIPPWRYGLGFTLTFRRQLLVYAGLWSQSVNFYDPSLPDAHDQWFFFLASSLGSIAYTTEPLVLYRQHANNVEGWRSASDIGARWKKMMAFDTLYFLKSRGAAAEKRAAILEQISARPDDALRANAHHAAAGYRRLAAHYARRLKLYLTPHLGERLSLYIKLLEDKSYTTGPWAVGRNEAIRDMIRGTFFPRKSA